MTPNDIYWVLASMIVAAIAVLPVALAVFLLATCFEFLRCRIRDVPFEPPLLDFMSFLVEGLFPSMLIMGVTLVLLKIFFGAGGT